MIGSARCGIWAASYRRKCTQADRARQRLRGGAGRSLRKELLKKLSPLSVIHFQAEKPLAHELAILIRLIGVEFREGGINGGERSGNNSQTRDVITEHVHKLAPASAADAQIRRRPPNSHDLPEVVYGVITPAETPWSSAWPTVGGRFVQ
jgi:hypothetical protein